MKRTIVMLISLIIAAFVISPSIVSAQTQAAHGPAYKTDQGLVRDLDLMTGMMTDINRLISRGNITVYQRQQIMKIMGEMGGVMQEMGSSPEIEGGKLRQQGTRLYEIKKRLDALKIEIESK